jgi:hypothetical protein
MKQRKAPVTIKTISATDISNLAQQFTHDAHAPLPRGRKLLYPEALSLTLALLQVAQQASSHHLLFG